MSDSTWTWISGSNSINKFGEYGTKGTTSSTNVPSSRFYALGWYDMSSQEFWLFGGHGYAAQGSFGSAYFFF